MDIGTRIKRIREQKGLTQEYIATVLGLAPQSVSKWERLEGKPSINNLPTLADALGVTLEYLLGGTNVNTDDENVILRISKEQVLKLIQNMDLSISTWTDAPFATLKGVQGHKNVKVVLIQDERTDG